MSTERFTMLSHGLQPIAYNRRMRRLCLLAAVFVLSAWGQKEPFTPQALMKLVRIGEPQLVQRAQSVGVAIEDVIESQAVPSAADRPSPARRIANTT